MWENVNFKEDLKLVKEPVVQLFVGTTVKPEIKIRKWDSWSSVCVEQEKISQEVKGAPIV